MLSFHRYSAVSECCHPGTGSLLLAESPGEMYGKKAKKRKNQCQVVCHQCLVRKISLHFLSCKHKRKWQEISSRWEKCHFRQVSLKCYHWEISQSIFVLETTQNFRFSHHFWSWWQRSPGQKERSILPTRDTDSNKNLKVVSFLPYNIQD